MTRKSAFLSLLILFLFALFFPAWAEGIENNPPTSSFTHEKDFSPLLRGVRGVSPTLPFTLEITNNLINLQAEQASFKEILKDLEKKTGIKVNIFEDVENKKEGFKKA